MSTMVNLGIGFQEPLTRPGVKLDEKMSNYSSDSRRSWGIHKFLAGGISRGFAARDGSAAKSHSTTTQYRLLRRLHKFRLAEK